MSDYLYNAISVLGEIDKEKYEELKAYFAGAPKWLIDSFQIIRMEKDYTFIRENEPVRYIYLIIEGIVRAADYRIYGIVYDFMRVNTLEAMGGMELVLDLPAYTATIDRKSRAYLFLQGADRLALYLVDNYKKNEKNGVFFVSSSRTELSEMTGLCVRTVNRAVKKFHENGWITKEGNKFSINKEQYMKMNETVSALIER